MFDFMKNELFYSIGILLDKKIISLETDVVCFGFNHYCRLSISFLLGAGIRKEKISIVDNYVKDNFKGINIEKPEEVLCPYNRNIVILVATSFNKEIIKQTKKMGYQKNVQIYETLKVDSKFYKYGSRIRVRYPNIYNRILNGCGYYLYKFKHKDICTITEKNRRFKDIHKGQRCFIMGNGPSLRDVKFELLANEYVFGVNQIMAVEGWEKAKINYWVCVDGNFLGHLNSADYDFYKEIQKLKNTDTIGFVPVEARYYCSRHKLYDFIELNYVNWKEQYINLDQNISISNIDMKKILMQPYNVVIGCINIAIYMGFKEIYLLGCNQSVLKDEIDYYLGEQKVNMHAIAKENDSSAVITIDRMRAKGMYYEIKNQLIQLTQFKILNEFCQRRNIKLINLSNPTLIESIQYIDAREIIK